MPCKGEPFGSPHGASHLLEVLPLETVNKTQVVSLRRLLLPGQPIIIEGTSANGGEHERWGQYHSRIQKVMDASMVVSTPRRRGSLVRFDEGAGVTVYVNRYGVRHSFQATVAKRGDVTPLVTRLAGISGLRRLERREDVRVEILVYPAEFALEGELSGSSRAFAPVVTDVSIGGLGLCCLRPIPMGSIIRVALDLPKVFGRVRAEGQVCQLFDQEHNAIGNRRWHVGVRYTTISEVDRDRIAAYVLYHQRRMRKQGVFTHLMEPQTEDDSSVPPGR